MEFTFNTNLNSCITTSPPIQTQTEVPIMAKLLPSIFIYFVARFMISIILKLSGLATILDCSLKQNSIKCSQFFVPASLSNVFEEIPASLEYSSGNFLQFKPMDEQGNKELLT